MDEQKTNDTEKIPGAYFCPACKFPVEDFSSPTCLVCGYQFVQGGKALDMVCSSCGAHVSAGSSSCPACGSARLEPKRILPPAAKSPHLVSYSAEGKKELFSLALAKTRIGRHIDNEIAFPEERSVSGRHCEIVLEDGKYVLRDLNSTNGIFVNGVKVTEKVLAHGDKIKLGVKMFRFEKL